MATKPENTPRARQLRALMAEIGLPDAFYARRFGCDAKTVWNWRNGHQFAPPEAVQWMLRLARFFRETPAPAWGDLTQRPRELT